MDRCAYCRAPVEGVPPTLVRHCGAPACHRAAEGLDDARVTLAVRYLRAGARPSEGHRVEVLRLAAGRAGAPL